MDQEYARRFWTPEAAEVEYERLARLLYPICVTQEGNDGPEADEIREKMELPWYAMDSEGQARLEALGIQLSKEYP